MDKMLLNIPRILEIEYVRIITPDKEDEGCYLTVTLFPKLYSKILRTWLPGGYKWFIPLEGNV